MLDRPHRSANLNEFHQRELEWLKKMLAALKTDKERQKLEEKFKAASHVDRKKIYDKFPWPVKAWLPKGYEGSPGAEMKPVASPVNALADDVQPSTAIDITMDKVLIMFSSRPKPSRQVTSHTCNCALATSWRQQSDQRLPGPCARYVRATADRLVPETPTIRV